MLIDNLMVDSGPQIFYNDAFRRVLESYIPWLIKNTSTQQITVDPLAAYRFEADFFSLLSYYNVPSYLHWLIMRMNKLVSPSDSDKNITSLYIPDGTTIEYIRQSFMSTSRIFN